MNSGLFSNFSMLGRLWQRILDTDLYFHLFEREKVKYTVAGECSQCGRCCRSLILGYRGKIVSSLKEFKKLRKSSEEYELYIPHEERAEDGTLRFHCREIGEDNRCKIHNLRPERCRNYPDPIMLDFGGKLLDGCGYHFKPVEKKDFASQLDDEISSRKEREFERMD